MDRNKAITGSGVSEEAIQQPHFLRSDTANDDAFIELIDVLRQVDTESPLAKLNETTISDNNGGRIEL